MIPKEFLDNASDEDRRVVRRWRIAVTAFYTAAGLALAIVAFVIHERGSTTEASGAADSEHAALLRKH